MFDDTDALITAVKAAYEKTGRRPCIKKWDDGDECCPLSALALVEDRHAAYPTGTITSWALDKALTEDEVWDFTCGVDYGLATYPGLNNKARKAGAAVRAALWPDLD